MITVKKEVEFIWRRKPTRITTLFFVNRYGILLYGALAITAGFVQEHTVCVVVTRATEAVILLLTLVFSICAALRAYVLWNKNWCFSIIVLAMNLAPEGVDIFLYWSSTPTSTPIVIASCVSRLRLGRQQQMRSKRKY
ncbi:hypothetical protein PsYK624_071400 [Phanerochaete sordida]|uniref:DUF6533 domain-containing protein n=1 Tax=Phanerochaete sordida TaxID=48140 RepID=A0A9P3G7Y1_9APHY|nr:hypothetical protein PsYK624_071400 [Phanerochaete sordida]